MGQRHEEERRVDFPGPIVIGAGPSGLAVAACLSQRGVPSLVLERRDCIASLWQHKTYDRLRLHLPKNFCELPLLGFPRDFPRYPTKRQFVQYMESYASRFSIEPKFNEEVLTAEFDQMCGVWRVQTKGCVYASRWLVVATGENAEPAVPGIPGLEKFRGSVVHTSGYKSGSGFRNKRVLVVGCGNSGMEVSLDLCRHNAMPHMVVRDTVHVLPREMFFGLSTFGVATVLLKWLPPKWVDRLLLIVADFKFGDTGRLGLRRPKTGPIELKNVTGRTPVLDVGALSQIKSGGIKVTVGVKEVTRTGARFVDGRELEFDSIILATGYKSNVTAWLKGEFEELFTGEGMGRGWKGIDGLYAAGLTRKGLLGIGQDAVRIAADVASQWEKDAAFVAGR
ncbi:hypothetical protein MLD38_006019 [Melastoma candidum]|uniref:Uncharacterized protein n=1 Tax=Melastoma candidum TaxID=119954 RepID=A0ACB9RLJ4_9MYRT|nr:hypothetical protein MLD38_006019 [Melastoma candidum]